MAKLSGADPPQPVSDGYRGGERRRNGHASQTANVTLEALPGLIVLEWIPAPVLAVGRDSTIHFANGAFVAMVGHSREALLSLTFHQIFHSLPAAESAICSLRAHAAAVVELMHAEGWTVRAKMSKSALLRHNDPVALAFFEDLTEQLWMTSQSSGRPRFA